MKKFIGFVLLILLFVIVIVLAKPQPIKASKASDINYIYDKDGKIFYYNKNWKDLDTVYSKLKKDPDKEYIIKASKDYDREKISNVLITNMPQDFSDKLACFDIESYKNNMYKISVKFIYNQDEKVEVEEKLDEIYKSLKINKMDIDYNKLLKIYNYIVENYEYELRLRSVYNSLQDKKLKCDGFSYLFKALSQRAGFTDVLTVNSVKGDFKHAFNMIKLDGVWYMVDCTLGRTTYVEEKDYLDYFLTTRYKSYQIGSFYLNIIKDKEATVIYQR